MASLSGVLKGRGFKAEEYQRHAGEPTVDSKKLEHGLGQLCWGLGTVIFQLSGFYCMAPSGVYSPYNLPALGSSQDIGYMNTAAVLWFIFSVDSTRPSPLSQQLKDK